MGDVLRDRLQLEDSLFKILDEAIALADLGQSSIPSHAIAERVFNEQTHLMSELYHLWAVDRLIWMIARRRPGATGRATPVLQLVLDDPLFKDLPETIYLRNGRRPKLDHCNTTQVDEYLKFLRERYVDHRKVAQMEAVLEKMRLYSGEKRGIRWGEVKILLADVMES